MKLEEIKIYIAGPLFTEAEKAFNAKVKQAIVDAGFKEENVFLPQEVEIDFESPTWKGDLFFKNLHHLDEARIVAAILDGPICDDGTSWEHGYAYANDKIIVGLRTDFRTVGVDGPVNLMLGVSTDTMTESIEELVANLLEYAVVLTAVHPDLL